MIPLFFRRIPWIFAALWIAAAGCSTTRPTPPPATPSVTPRESLEAELRRERALRHFIDGALYDSKGEYARAILEYQEALSYEPNAAIYYAISRDYSALGKHALAAQAAREAIRLDSLNIAYRENLASILLNAYELELATREYETIVRIDSSYSAGWYGLARLYQASKPLKALEIYERLLNLEGDTWDYLLQAAELCRTLGRYDEAADKYRRMLELDPGNRPLQRQLAETYSRAGKFEEALKILEAMLQIDEDDPDVISSLADTYLDRNDFPRALELYQQLLDRGHTDPEIKLRIGISYYGMIQRDSTMLPKAKAIFEEVREAQPRDWRAFLHLGAIAMMEHQDSVAAENFERVTQLAEWNADAWWYLGSTYFEQGAYGRLLPTMDRAARLHPNDFRFPLLAGLAYSQLKQPEQAIEKLERALALNPNDVNTLGTLALTYDGLHQYEKSDSLYERALSLNPDSHIILNNYSYSLAERGIQLERALAMAQKAVAAEPENASYLDTLGWVYFKLKDLDEARRYIAEAVATGRASATVHEHLGDIYFMMGEREKAVEYWQKALQMTGENQALREKIERGTL